MKYSKKDNIYYKDNEELDWFKNIKEESIENCSLEMLKIKKWRISLLNYFNSPFLNKKTFFIDKELDDINERITIKLNIDTLLNLNYENIPKWKKDLLFQLDKYLKSDFLIKRKILSLQFIGSLGSKYPLKYSDFDCVIILPKHKVIQKNLSSIKNLIHILRLFSYAFDQNQHHDIFILTEDELIHGIKPFYPLKLFEDSWGYGKDFIFTEKNNLNPIRKLNLLNNNQFFRSLNYQKTKSVSMFNYKYILSCAFMTPVYFYNFQNKFYSKHQSIKLAKIENKSIVREFDLISNIRLKWPEEEKTLIRNFILKNCSKIISYNKIINLNKMLGYYFYQRRYNYFFKFNEIGSVIKIGKTISDHFIKKLMRV